jgi:hypothetical protein
VLLGFLEDQSNEEDAMNEHAIIDKSFSLGELIGQQTMHDYFTLTGDGEGEHRTIAQFSCNRLSADKPPVEEPPNEPQKPPVKEPGDTPDGPPDPIKPPMEEPWNDPPQPPVKEPPPEDPERTPPQPPKRMDNHVA